MRESLTEFQFRVLNLCGWQKKNKIEYFTWCYFLAATKEQDVRHGAAGDFCELYNGEDCSKLGRINQSIDIF